MMPRYSRREAVVLLLLALALALYIWSPLFFSRQLPVASLQLKADQRPETRESDKSPVLGVRGKPRPTGPVDLNEASQSELEELPGIGPTLADRIVRHRDRYGPFQEPEDLMQVKGIGEKRYERIRLWITVRNP